LDTVPAESPIDFEKGLRLKPLCGLKTSLRSLYGFSAVKLVRSTSGKTKSPIIFDFTDDPLFLN